MNSSGTTAVATSGAGLVNLIALAGLYQQVSIINEGSAPGFFTLDGVTFGRIPATGSITLNGVFTINSTIQIKRDGSADMTGVWAFALTR